MFKYNKYTLKKLEAILEELQYTVRYEKGNFQAGYCIVDTKKIVIVNKFFETEGRINCLLDILQAVEVDTSTLSESSSKFYRQINRTKATEEEIPSDAAPEEASLEAADLSE
jgi:hypothetical protein